MEIYFLLPFFSFFASFFFFFKVTVVSGHRNSILLVWFDSGLVRAKRAHSPASPFCPSPPLTALLQSAGAFCVQRGTTKHQRAQAETYSKPSFSFRSAFFQTSIRERLGIQNEAACMNYNLTVSCWNSLVQPERSQANGQLL